MINLFIFAKSDFWFLLIANKCNTRTRDEKSSKTVGKTLRRMEFPSPSSFSLPDKTIRTTIEQIANDRRDLKIKQVVYFWMIAKEIAFYALNN